MHELPPLLILPVVLLVFTSQDGLASYVQWLKQSLTIHTVIFIEYQWLDCFSKKKLFIG